MQAQLPPALERMDECATRNILVGIWEALNVHNEHWMHCIVGREGSGKSYTALKLGELLDPTFTVDRVIFDPTEFLADLRDENYEEGEIYVLDESGVSFGKRTWQSRDQVKLNQALQLIRNHNIGLIFTLPRLGELDSQTEGRLHTYFEIMAKEPDEYVRGRWRILDPDRVNMTNEVYKQKPTYDGRGVDTIAFTPPDSDDLVETYEEVKTQFQKEFYDEAIQEATGDTDEVDEKDPQNIAEKIRNNGGVEQYIQEINNGTQVVLSKELIAADYNIGDRRAKKVKALLRQDVDREGVL